MKPDHGFTTDETGKPSAMRLMSFLSFLFSAGLAVSDAFGVAEVGFETILVFLVAGFAPKAVQKFAER